MEAIQKQSGVYAVEYIERGTPHLEQNLLLKTNDS
jgi:hypothetical protein